MTTSQGIKLDDKTRDRLKALAEKRQRSPHWLMRTAIEAYLEREEKYEHEKTQDMARWEHYVFTGEAIEHDNVEPWLKGLAQNKTTPWPQ